MSETTVVEPLSGEEIMTTVQEAVKRALIRDCHMNPVFAYQGASIDVYIKARLNDCGRVVEIEENVHVDAPQPADEDALLLEAEEHLYDSTPPNQVRQEAGLPIPTLVEDSEGRKEVKRVKYARKPEAK